MTDGEWEERQKTRQLEMEACSKALAVLSSDSWHFLYSVVFVVGLATRNTIAFDGGAMRPLTIARDAGVSKKC